MWVATDAVDHAPHVHAEDPAVVLERLAPREPAGEYAGIVADDVHGAERVEGAPRERVDLVLARHVGLDGQHLGAAAGELAGRGGQRAGLDVGHDDLHALVRERRGERAADAARGAGHHRDPACESFHDRS